MENAARVACLDPGSTPGGSTCKVDLILERCLDVLAVNVLVVVN